MASESRPERLRPCPHHAPVLPIAAKDRGPCSHALTLSRVSISVFISSLAALACAILAIAALARSQRSLSQWAFAAGLAVLALERGAAAFSLGATTLEAVARWQEIRMLVLGALPF